MKNYILRYIQEDIKNKLNVYSKIIVIYGPRQVGKTTLVKELLHGLPYKALSVTAEDKLYAEIFSSQSLNRLKDVVAGYDLLFVDEAQRIPEIGLNIKLLHDAVPQLKIILTGSSSFDLASKIAEPLTGREWAYKLYPISFLELNSYKNRIELDVQLEERLVYGSYPEIFNISNLDDKRVHLRDLSTSYLYKDILELASIKNSSKVHDLLKLLAFQVGSQVSLAELSIQLGMSKDTVFNYIDLLEKSYVVFRLNGFSRNLRKEVTKMDKIYFYDNGVRNVLIDNLKPLSFRNDIGQLWENFLVSERKKVLEYKKILSSTYFWRLYTGAELDYIEERDGELWGYEFKWGTKRTPAPQSWLQIYANAKYMLINRESYLDFVL